MQWCNELATYGFGLPISVLDVEYQYDRRKLTVYYDCVVRIDFRDFVRQMYSTYKARIWMKKVPRQDFERQVEVEAHSLHVMALATGVQFSPSAAML
ncbi:PSP1 C-terminal conserved region-domain-containing protein [Ochromonadaceae sp. CCMP2298]|nr:PSP1 C-terminal conserved region-domain-containing protein [Ochromonadaceae sp. CCMP2298]